MIAWTRILYCLLVIAGVCFLVSGIDDLFVDGYYYTRKLYRRLFVLKKYPQLTEEDLRKVAEKSIAILVPAWQEQAVIAQMLEHTLRTVDYGNYEIFVGTYPNDDPTMMAVASVQEHHARVHRIVCPHDGPTNKADCLNWVVEGIRLYEKTASKQFEIFVMHDSEDIVHPLSLKVMNYLIPRMHMVQLPVTPLEMPWTKFTAGTYLDEFAEFHSKDLLVRERVSRMLPSAGVGTGFSRQALDELAGKTQNQLFNIETVTEDYDIGFRLKDLAKKAILLQFRVERARVVRTGLFRKRERVKRVREWVTTREFFPVRFRDAVRQKSRWIVGIVFQGWRHLGWRGNAGMRYMLWRDRKALFGSFLNIVGYLLFFSVLGTYVYNLLADPHALTHFPVLVRHGTWLWYVILADTILMFHRIMQRMVAVHRFAGWPQAFLSIPRLFWGNVLNFVAVSQASWHFVRSAWTGQKIAWAKTAHAFPDEKQLVEFRRKLGDLLLENRLISMKQLAHAIEVQKHTRERLGETLARLGYVQEDALLPILGAQMRIESRWLEGVRIAAPPVIPEHMARQYRMLVIDNSAEGLVVAAANPRDTNLKTWLDTNLGRPYRVVLAGTQNILAAIDVVYGATQRGRMLLGELLLQSGVITVDQLETGLRRQKQTGRPLGKILEELGYISHASVQAHLQWQRSSEPSNGISTKEAVRTSQIW